MNKILITTLLISSVNASAECHKEFDTLLEAIETSETSLQNNIDNFHIEVLSINNNGKLIEKKILKSVPEKYAYNGRLFPDKKQQQELNITLYTRRIVFKNIRVVTEKDSKGAEPSSYWFNRVNNCWKLTSRAINVHM